MLIDQELQKEVWLEIKDGVICSINSGTTPEYDLRYEGILIPGFVDIHCHGGGGKYFASLTDSEISQVIATHRAGGTVAGLASLVTEPIENLISQIKRLVPFAQRGEIAGIHLEGPFISTAKPGVHPLDYFQIPNLDLIGKYLRAGSVAMVTIAPELPGAIEVIKHLTAMGIVVSLGHSNATAEEAHAGFDAGAKTVTHLWNAMPPMTLRSPGLVGVALERDDVTIQIIVDGVHVAPEVVQATIAAAPDRFIVTNDAVAPAGLGEGKFPFGTFEVEVKAGRAVRSDGVLAGGVESLYGSLNFLLDLGVNLESAIASMTSRPAALIGQGHIGSLDLGAPVQVIPA